jgi:hypothetical protein
MINNQIIIKDDTVILSVDMYIKKATELHYLYIPALKLIVHAKTAIKAEKSMDSAIKLFFKNDKEAVNQKLIKLGWTYFESTKEKLTPPEKFQVPSILMGVGRVKKGIHNRRLNLTHRNTKNSVAITKFAYTS